MHRSLAKQDTLVAKIISGILPVNEIPVLLFPGKSKIICFETAHYIT
jgi:hypothetical protein